MSPVMFVLEVEMLALKNMPKPTLTGHRTPKWTECPDLTLQFSNDTLRRVHYEDFDISSRYCIDDIVW